MKNKKMIMIIAGIIGAIGLFLPYTEIIILKQKISIIEILGISLYGIGVYIRKKYHHRGDEIKKIFENSTEENKTKIYNYVKEIEEKQKMELNVNIENKKELEEIK